MKLFQLIISLKNLYTDHPLLLAVTRMLSLIDGEVVKNYSSEILSNSTKEKKKTKVKTKQELLGGNGSSGSSANPKKIVFSDCAIPLPVLNVYLYARSCLLQDYSGERTLRVTYCLFLVVYTFYFHFVVRYA
jgi:hypothetical protein